MDGRGAGTSCRGSHSAEGTPPSVLEVARAMGHDGGFRRRAYGDDLPHRLRYDAKALRQGDVASQVGAWERRVGTGGAIRFRAAVLAVLARITNSEISS